MNLQSPNGTFAERLARGLTAAGVGVVVVSACSGNPSSLTVQCGPGTRLSKGECLEVPADGSPNDGSLGDGPSGETAPADASGVSDAATDASTDITVRAETGGSDATDAQGDGNTIGADDPCPDSSLPPLWSDCSGQCLAVDAGGTSLCGTGGGSGLVCPSYYLPPVGTPGLPTTNVVIRTPDHPVSFCEQTCTSDAQVGITASVAFLAPHHATIEVGLPWHIAVSPNYDVVAGCGNRSPYQSGAQCLDAFSEVVSIWTDALDPPAKNIIIRYDVSCAELYEPPPERQPSSSALRRAFTTLERALRTRHELCRLPDELRSVAFELPGLSGDLRGAISWQIATERGPDRNARGRTERIASAWLIGAPQGIITTLQHTCCEAHSRRPL